MNKMNCLSIVLLAISVEFHVLAQSLQENKRKDYVITNVSIVDVEQ